MDAITIDGLDENDFRCSIEAMLRLGEADDAARKLRALLQPYAGEGKILPARFLSVSSADVALVGWDALEERIREYDRPDHRISAFSVAITEPEAEGVEPDAAGKLAPCVETLYFSDDAFPFSEAGRNDLLDGYSIYGCEWQGNFEKVDATLAIEGIDDLYGAIARLEARLLASDAPSQDEIRAGSLGACYLAVLIHQAVHDSVVKHGLPRALCVMAGSNGVYPFFDAPVISSEEYLGDNGIDSVLDDPLPAAFDSAEAETGEPADDHSGYQSLLSINVRKDKKKPVLMLDPAEAENAARIGELAAAQQLAEAGPRSGVIVNLHASDQAGHAPSFADHRESDTFEDAARFRDPVDPPANDEGGQPLQSDAPAPADAESIDAGQEDDWEDAAAVADEAEFAHFSIAEELDDADLRESDDADVRAPHYADPHEPGDADPREPDYVDPYEPDYVDLHEADEELTHHQVVVDAADDLACSPEIELPAAIEERPVPAEAETIDAPADPREFATPERAPPSPKPEPNPHHRLRARLVATPQISTTLADRVVSFLQWFHDWLKRKGL